MQKESVGFLSFMKMELNVIIDHVEYDNLPSTPGNFDDDMFFNEGGQKFQRESKLVIPRYMSIGHPLSLTVS